MHPTNPTVRASSCSSSESSIPSSSASISLSMNVVAILTTKFWKKKIKIVIHKICIYRQLNQKNVILFYFITMWLSGRLNGNHWENVFIIHVSSHQILRCLSRHARRVTWTCKARLVRIRACGSSYAFPRQRSRTAWLKKRRHNYETRNSCHIGEAQF